MCARSPTLSDESALRTCKELGMKKQDFESIQDCNGWNKNKCPRYIYYILISTLIFNELNLEARTKNIH